MLREFDAASDELLRALGFPPDLFDDADRTISYRDGARLLAACAERTRCPHFGLLVGQRCSLAGLGLVGHTARTSASVREALTTIARYLPLFDRGSALALRHDGDDASFVFGIMTAGMPGVNQVYDLAIAVVFNTLRELCGSCWRPSAVTLPHKAPPDTRPYQSYFAADVLFDEADAAINFDRFWLARPLETSVSAERLRLLDQATKVESLLDLSVSEQVRRRLRANLPARWLTEHEVARALSLSDRVLRMRLAEEGESFRSILRELRYETAQQFLAASSLELSHIALLLGYSELSALTRAFQRWSGVSPSVWRARHAVAEPAPQQPPLRGGQRSNGLHAPR